MPLEERREALLDAAMRVLTRDGYGGLTISAIAAEAGVTRPVVYDACGGIDPLLHALLDRTERRATASVLALIPTGEFSGELDRWLVEAIDGLLEAVRSDQETWRPALGLVDGTPPPAVRERVETTRAMIGEFVADTLRASLDPGADLDVEVVAHSLVALAEEFARLLLGRPDDYPKERLVAAYVGMLSLRR